MLTDRAYELERILLPFAKEPDSHINWIGGGDGDAGPDYCGRCCDAIVRALKHEDRRDWRLGGRRRRRKEYLAEGGYDIRESDGSAVCSECGEPLTYSLTNYGLCEEVRHFAESDMGDCVRRPEGLYELTRILAAVQYTGEDDIKAEAIALGEAAVALLQPSDFHSTNEGKNND